MQHHVILDISSIIYLFGFVRPVTNMFMYLQQYYTGWYEFFKYYIARRYGYGYEITIILF
jgi:hypothetical protein